MSTNATAASRRWMFFALGSVLLLGTSLGVLADRLVLSNDKDSPSRPVSGEIWFDCSREPIPRDSAEHKQRRVKHLAEMQEALLLEDRQVGEISNLLDGHGEAARRFWHDTRVEYCGMLLGLRDDVRQLLNEEQQGLFAIRTARIDERMRKAHQRPSRGD